MGIQKNNIKGIREMEVIERVKKEATERRKIRRLLIELEKLNLIDGWHEAKSMIECNGYRYNFNTDGTLYSVEKLLSADMKRKYLMGIKRMKWDIDYDIAILDAREAGLTIPEIAEKMQLPVDKVISRYNALKKYGFIDRFANIDML